MVQIHSLCGTTGRRKVPYNLLFDTTLDIETYFFVNTRLAIWIFRVCISILCGAFFTSSSLIITSFSGKCTHLIPFTSTKCTLSEIQWCVYSNFFAVTFLQTAFLMHPRYHLQDPFYGDTRYSSELHLSDLKRASFAEIQTQIRVGHYNYHSKDKYRENQISFRKFSVDIIPNIPIVSVSQSSFQPFRSSKQTKINK